MRNQEFIENFSKSICDLEYMPMSKTPYVGNNKYLCLFGEAVIEIEQFIIISKKSILPIDLPNIFTKIVEPEFLYKNENYTTHHQDLEIKILSKTSGNEMNVNSSQLVLFKKGLILDSSKETNIKYYGNFTQEELNNLYICDLKFEYQKDRRGRDWTKRR